MSRCATNLNEVFEPFPISASRVYVLGLLFLKIVFLRLILMKWFLPKVFGDLLKMLKTSFLVPTESWLPWFSSLDAIAPGINHPVLQDFIKDTGLKRHLILIMHS